MKKGGILPFALLLALSAFNGSAEAADDSKKFFAEGQQLIVEKKWDEAIEKFRASYELAPNPDVLLWKGYAYEQKGSLLAAKETYTQALQLANEGKLGAEAERATKALETIQTKIPRIRVQLPKGVVGAEMYLDATKRDMRDKGVEVDPGEHMIVVTAPGRQTFHVQLIVRAGDELEVEAVMPSKILASTKKKTPAPKPIIIERESRTLAIAVTSLGGTFALTGGVMMGVAYGETNARLSVMGVAMGGVGLVFTMLGGAALIASAFDKPAHPKKPEKAASKWATVAPLPGGAWASVGGSF